MKFLLVFLLLLQVPVFSQQLSKYVSYKEAFVSISHKNIPNVPDFCQVAMVKDISITYIDALRERIGNPLYFTSVFRSFELNKAVGGATNSDHMILGDVVAFDIDQDGKGVISNKAIFDIVRKEFSYFKIIWEFGTSSKPQWIHLSFSINPIKNQIKKAYRSIKVGNKTIYQNYTSDSSKSNQIYA